MSTEVGLLDEKIFKKLLDNEEISHRGGAWLHLLLTGRSIVCGW